MQKPMQNKLVPVQCLELPLGPVCTTEVPNQQVDQGGFRVCDALVYRALDQYNARRLQFLGFLMMLEPGLLTFY